MGIGTKLGIFGLSGASSFSNTYSIDLDGVNDYIDLGNPTELQITTSLSVSLWFKSTDSTDYVLICKDNAHGHSINDRSWTMWGNRYGGTNVIIFGIRNGSSTFSAIGTTDYNDGNWHHVVGVFEPSTAVRLYVDGNLETENTTSIPATMNDVGKTVQIGRNADGQYVMDGQIDETGIFTSVLSASDVTAIYNGGVPKSLASYSPVGWWRFEEGSGTTAGDSSGNSNDGTLTNGAAYIADVPN